LQKSIIITEDQKQILSKHAKDNEPDESCALLLGHEEQEQSIVKQIYLAKNVEESPVNFTISNEELLKGYQLAEEEKLEVIGIFHSHPKSETIPSTTDQKFMHSNPVVWVIFSGMTNEFKAYFLDSKVIEVKITS